MAIGEYTVQQQVQSLGLTTTTTALTCNAASNKWQQFPVLHEALTMRSSTCWHSNGFTVHPVFAVPNCYSLLLQYWFLILGPILLVTVLLHELGHCLAARSVGGTAHSILLWPLGGLAYIGSHNKGPKGKLAHREHKPAVVLCGQSPKQLFAQLCSSSDANATCAQVAGLVRGTDLCSTFASSLAASHAASKGHTWHYMT
eukprot:GHRR01010599.1.p2 GENE.GHRR01010599.1~~GHRR01010599.1.p2  ORF type:complete len:200 (+),score=40.60 GHRR01010599.1:1064-1663(+)